MKIYGFIRVLGQPATTTHESMCAVKAGTEVKTAKVKPRNKLANLTEDLCRYAVQTPI